MTKKQNEQTNKKTKTGTHGELTCTPWGLSSKRASIARCLSHLYILCTFYAPWPIRSLSRKKSGHLSKEQTMKTPGPEVLIS